MELPKKLAYQRSLSPSQAIFYSVDTQGELKPLNISETKIVGQKSSSTEGFDSTMKAKISATPRKLSEGNPHVFDYCYVPPDASSVLCKFSLRVDASSLSPLTCDDSSATQALRLFSQKYQQRGGYKLLAERYLKNILSGSWLWRNQETMNTDIEVTTSNGTSYRIEQIHRRRFDVDWEENIENWVKLVDEFESALTSPKKYLLLEITAKMCLGFAQELYPSQSFFDREETNSSRMYQSVMLEQRRVPVMGAYKVGAAIACIDDWYPDAGQRIRVGAYGVDKANQTAYRSPNTQKDLFSLLIQIEVLTQQMIDAASITDDCHFVAANLVKGGLFQIGKS